MFFPACTCAPVRAALSIVVGVLSVIVVLGVLDLQPQLHPMVVTIVCTAAGLVLIFCSVWLTEALADRRLSIREETTLALSQEQQQQQPQKQEAEPRRSIRTKRRTVRFSVE